MKRNIVLGVIGLLVVAGMVLASINASRVPVQTVVVERGKMVEYIDERGKTRLPKTFDITMPFEGRIEEIELIEGDSVAAGQLVAQISPADLAIDVAEARAAVQRLQASIVENDDTRLERSARAQADDFVESMSFTVQAADARRDASQSRLDYLEKTFGRVRDLWEQQATSLDAYEEAFLLYNESQKTYRQDDLVHRAMISIQAATSLLPAMVEDYIEKKSLSRAVLEKQQAEANARLDAALTRQQRGQMASPVDGVVLNRPVFAEQYLGAGTLLMTVGRLAELEIEADILSQDVVRVRPGDRVEVYGPATGRSLGNGFTGTVERIYPAGFSKRSSLGVEQQRVKTVVSLSDEARGMMLEAGVGVDFRVRVRVFSAEKDNCLVVPRAALFRSPRGDWEMFVIRGGKARRVSVEVGLVNDEQAEIVGGVEEGEQVVVAPDSSLHDGVRVRVDNGD